VCGDSSGGVLYMGDKSDKQNFDGSRDVDETINLRALGLRRTKNE